MEVPTLSELCAQRMMAGMQPRDKLLVLERLKQTSRRRTEALERELEQIDAGGRNRGSSSSSSSSSSSAAASPEHSPRRESKRREAKELELEDEAFEREQALKFKKVAEEAKQRRRTAKEIFEWKQRFTQLTHKAQVLERERNAALRAARAGLEQETAELERQEADLSLRRSHTRREVHDQLDKVKWTVQRLRSTVDAMGSGEAYVRSIQQLAEQSEQAIAVMQEHQRGVFESLITTEHSLWAQVEEARDRMESEEAQHRAHKKDAAVARRRRRNAAPVSPANSVSPRGVPRCALVDASAPAGAAGSTLQKLRSTVEDIDLAIQDAGGSTGGWDERDHTAFLRCVSRLKVPESVLIRYSAACEKGRDCDGSASPSQLLRKLAERAALDTPTEDEESAMAHVRWYGSYLGLLARKKAALAEWKAARGSRGSGRAKEQADPNAPCQTTARKPSPQAKAKQVQSRRGEAEARRKAVAEWRASQERERRRAEQARQAAEEAERERQALQAARRRKEKEQIALFKLEREAELARQKRFQASVDNELKSSERARPTVSLKERQARALALAASRRATVQERSAAAQDRAARIAQIKVKPAVRPDFADKLRRRQGDALSQATTAFKAKSLTPEELGELQERRARTAAHDSAVPSAAGVGMGGRSYGIGVKNLVSGRAAATWRRG